MRQVMIETEDSARRGARRGRSMPKGRSFDALLVAHVQANGLWDGGAGGGEDVVRPAWALFACDEGTRVPLVANLRCGRKAREYSDTAWGGRSAGRVSFEFLRSAGYEFVTQRAPEGALVQVFHRGLFAFDPGGAEEKVRGVLAPPRAWLEAQAVALGAGATAASKAARERVDAEDMAPQPWIEEPRFAALATLFAASLDRRLRAPLVPDVAFQGQLFAAALLSGFVGLILPECDSTGRWWRGTDAHGLSAEGLTHAGLGAVLALRGNAAEVEALLAAEVRRYDQRAARRRGRAGRAALTTAEGV